MLWRLRGWWEMRKYPVVSKEDAHLRAAPMTKAALRRGRFARWKITSQVNDSRNQEHDQQD